MTILLLKISSPSALPDEITIISSLAVFMVRRW